MVDVEVRLVSVVLTRRLFLATDRPIGKTANVWFNPRIVHTADGPVTLQVNVCWSPQFKEIIPEGDNTPEMYKMQPHLHEISIVILYNNIIYSHNSLCSLYGTICN